MSISRTHAEARKCTCSAVTCLLYHSDATNKPLDKFTAIWTYYELSLTVLILWFEKGNNCFYASLQLCFVFIFSGHVGSCVAKFVMLVLREVYFLLELEIQIYDISGKR